MDPIELNFGPTLGCDIPEEEIRKGIKGGVPSTETSFLFQHFLCDNQNWSAVPECVRYINCIVAIYYDLLFDFSILIVFQTIALVSNTGILGSIVNSKSAIK